MYNTQAAFELYVYYLAIKRHFTSKYDYFKYNGKINVKRTTFNTRKDKYQFFKLSKHKHAQQLILSNMIQNPNVWIGDLLTAEAEAILAEWLKRQQSITYFFKSEIEHLDDDFDKNFIVVDGDYPPTLKMYIQKKISLETLIILTDLTGCLSHWSKKISDSVLWPEINRTLNKTKPFLTYSKDKLRQLLLDKYTTVQ